MIILLLLLIAIVVSAVICGLTPDNVNLYICIFTFVIAFEIYKGISDYDDEKNPVLNYMYLLIAIIFTLAMSSFSKVDTGHTGILVSFGKTDEKTYGEGIIFRAPWKNMIQIDNRIQKNGHDDMPLSLTAFTKDTQQVSINYTVNYRINKENASKLYKEIGLDYFKTVLTPIIQESVKIECAKYTANELLENRDRLAQDIEKDIKIKFSQNYIDLTATAIEDLSFSDEYEKAVEQKQVALQDKLKAEQEAEKKKVVADADAYVEIAKAKAEAEANELKNKTISDNLIRYEAVQKWNGQLPTVEGGTTPIIDLR